MERRLSSLQEEQIKQAWERFDIDKDGYIYRDELLSVMHELGLKASENDVDDLLKEFDTDNNGAIDYNEFVVMMASSMKAA